MASSTKHRKARKALKKAARGRRRKNHERIHGSTAPALPLNKPTANEIALKKQS